MKTAKLFTAVMFACSMAVAVPAGANAEGTPDKADGGNQKGEFQRGPVMDGQGPHGYGRRNERRPNREDHFFQNRKFWRFPRVVEDLGLTEKQIDKLEKTAAEWMAKVDKNRNQLVKAWGELRRIMDSDKKMDMKAITEMAEKIGELEGSQTTRKIIGRAAVMNRLQDKQRARLDNGRDWRGPRMDMRRDRRTGRGYGPGDGYGRGRGYGRRPADDGRNRPADRPRLGMGNCGCPDDCPNRRENRQGNDQQPE